MTAPVPHKGSVASPNVAHHDVVAVALTDRHFATVLSTVFAPPVTVLSDVLIELGHNGTLAGGGLRGKGRAQPADQACYGGGENERFHWHFSSCHRLSLTRISRAFAALERGRRPRGSAVCKQSRPNIPRVASAAGRTLHMN
jgi:hypothetical protein